MPGARPGQIMAGVNHGSVPSNTVLGLGFSNSAAPEVSGGRGGEQGTATHATVNTFVFGSGSARTVESSVQRSSSGGISMVENHEAITFNLQDGVAKIGEKKFDVGKRQL
ncbi:uncharacterized protein N7496_006020 [Penicillium cataractarum]|uniref:Uncharacterized protein n=1 Tax=Penicillium cataractarum TaxID=2100454 RepID=A0A9W9S5F5_9EURO|nr:uncharacterized protein N7496_006020 [Penicillium cataractarum]KAJ5369928.1 hypothetical protein N7496_006020 [Penicillium cataractarum]